MKFAKRHKICQKDTCYLPKGHEIICQKDFFLPKGHRAPNPNPWEKIFFAILICVLYLALPLADFRQKRHVSRSRTYFNGCFPSD